MNKAKKFISTFAINALEKTVYIPVSGKGVKRVGVRSSCSKDEATITRINFFGIFQDQLLCLNIIDVTMMLMYVGTIL